ncbi:MAG: retroviral-like aspartic protease [Chloroflexota bacterium]|nr:retroviral-like aspartic protease [Chloroflexota bacterium]
MSDPIQFAYTALKNPRGETIFRPLLNMTLTTSTGRIETLALMDAGADVNVLPYRLGVELGLIWEDHVSRIQLSGNLGAAEAKTVVLTGNVAAFSPAVLIFVWTRADLPYPILGHLNFLMEFNMCFFGAERVFEISAT